MNYTPKYYKSRPRGPNSRGRASNPESWCTGPDQVQHDKYYAWLKHRAQARFRSESYGLDFEDWCEFWTDEHWFKRGKSGDSLCLSRLDWSTGWHKSNCAVMTRREHLKLNKTKS